jgi:ChrR Cupin-like domain
MAAASLSRPCAKRFGALVQLTVVVAMQIVFADNVSGAGGPSDRSAALEASTVLDLNDLRKNPGNYTWFDFRPNLKKLILSGDANTEHVSILWYTVADGSVGLHYHAKTESVYVIDGTQTDAKGTYPTGTLYFNPPGSGHAIKDSSGFFILAYASPPDFSNTALIGEYKPVRIDTAGAKLESELAFEKGPGGARRHRLALDPNGGMSAELIHIDASARYTYRGNYLLTLKGACEIEGQSFGRDMLVVATTVQPQSYVVRSGRSAACFAIGVSFS